VSDESSKNFAIKYGLEYFEMKYIREHGTYLSPSAMKIYLRKFEAIKHVLNTGYNVLYVDTDIVFLKNPMCYISSVLRSNDDIYIQSDEQEYTTNKPMTSINKCTGFLYIKNTINSNNIVDNCILRIKDGECDQSAFNNVIYTSTEDLKIFILDEKLFLNGHRAFSNGDSTTNIKNAIVVHNNYLIGIDEKHNRFQRYGLLFPTFETKNESLVNRLRTRSICDYYYGRDTNISKFTKFKYRDIICIEQYFIQKFFDEVFSLIPVDIILCIIDDAINSTDKSAYNYKNFLDYKNIIRVYSEDWKDISHTKLTILPIGFESRLCVKNEEHKLIDTSKKSKKLSEKPLKVLSNFQFSIYEIPVSGNYNQRKECIESLLENEYIDFWKNKKDRYLSWELHNNYTFVLCPEGNGIDTHRFYESILNNTIPIVKRNSLYNLYKQFPCIIVDNWDEITLPNLTKWKTKFVQSGEYLDQTLLKLDYWRSKMLTVDNTEDLDKKFKLSQFYEHNNIKLVEGFSQQNPKQVELLAKLSKNAEYILEIGFHAGHSTEIFLNSNNYSHVTSFDINQYNTVYIGKQFIDKEFPKRHTLITGDSRETVKKYPKNKIKFDLIFIDGGHHYEIVKEDFKNCMELADSDTIIVLDDTVKNPYLQRWWNDGPNRIWNEYKQNGLLTEIASYDYDEAGRGCSYGYYNKKYDVVVGDIPNIDFWIDTVNNECSWIDTYYGILSELINERGYKNIIEIGVAYGGHGENLLTETSCNYIGIDPYIASYDPKDLFFADVHRIMKGNDKHDSMNILYINVLKRLSKFRNRCNIIREDSKNVACLIEEKSTDVIFIDGNHLYDNVVSDIKLYWPKIRPGGVLAGDDYNWPDVYKAVNEFASVNNIKIKRMANTHWYFDKF
jgi:predicted O-methyltransferase YrrM